MTMIIDDTNEPSEERIEVPSVAQRSKAAERMRVLRKRRREGIRCITLDLRETEVDRLVYLGHLRQADREDKNQVLLALYRFLDQTDTVPHIDDLFVEQARPPSSA
jgi:hypothetical protein